MTRLALTFLRGGWPRALLLAGCTAAATGLLLVAVAMLRLPEQPAEALFDLVAQPGLRGGTALATVLLVLPLLLLLYQVVRLGTAARERRLAALRLAGATPREVRRLGAVEVGLPVAVGAVAGLGTYAVLRALFGGQPLEQPSGMSGSGFGLVPTSVAPTWWQTVSVVTGLALIGVLTGVRASRHLVASPLGVTRRQAPPPPRPWGVALIVVGGALAGAAVARHGRDGSEALGLLGVLLAVLGVVTLAPWAAFRTGRAVAARTGSPATLLAARHLVTDPRPAGRAAAAIGAIALVSGGAARLEAQVFADPDGRGLDPFFVASFALVAAALLVALLVTTSTLIVHAVESLLDRRRSLAALVAARATLQTLTDATRREATMTALPLASGGAILGALAVGALRPDISPLGLAIVTLHILLTVALAWLAIRISARAVRPWLVRATAATNLRTE